MKIIFIYTIILSIIGYIQATYWNERKDRDGFIYYDRPNKSPDIFDRVFGQESKAELNYQKSPTVIGNPVFGDTIMRQYGDPRFATTEYVKYGFMIDRCICGPGARGRSECNCI